jgi:hypothetical protein
MSTSKFIAIALTTFVCATALAVDARAQRGGGGGHGGGGGSAGRGGSGGGHAPSGGHGPTTGPSGSYRGATVYHGAPGHGYPGYGYRPYYGYGYRPYYGYGYGYGCCYGYGYPGFSIGFGFGYPYAYGYYGYGYPYYYPYAAPAPDAYVVPGYAASGGVRIQGVARNTEVYVDGTYAGVVDDYDGVFQRLGLEPGAHAVEIRTAGHPTTYDVNVSAGQTITIHANAR